MIPIYNILYNNAHKITQSSNIAPKNKLLSKINNNHIYNIIKTSSDHRSRIIIISLILYYYIIRVMKTDPTKENTKLI